MTDFSQNITLTASNGFSNPPVGATGKTALPTAFGVSFNHFGFNSLNDSGGTGGSNRYVAAYNTVGGYGLLRPNPDNFNSTFTNGNPNVSLDGNGNLTSCSEIDNFIAMVKAINFTGQIICNSGGHAGMSGTTAQQAANIVKVAKYCREVKGVNITHWESYNEPSGTVGNSAAASFCSALITAFANAGAPYNTYTISGPVAPNVTTSGDPSLWSAFSSVSGMKAVNFHTYGSDNFAPEGNFTTQILSCIASGNSYGMRVNDARNFYTGSLPVFLGEYNMDGGPQTFETGQLTQDGGCYAALAIMDAIKIGNVEMMGIWAGIEDSPSTETYGIFNGASNQTNLAGTTFGPYHIYPTGYIISRMFQKMPGKVVQTTGTSSITISPSDGSVTGGSQSGNGASSSYTTSGTSIYTMATVQPGTSNFGVCICNYGTSTVTGVVVTISTGPASITRWECGTNNLAPATSSVTSTQLAAGISIPPRTVVILSP